MPIINTCDTNFVSYGEYQFNAFVKSNASIQPIMADDSYTIKYQRVTFECEFVITTETVQLLGSTTVDLDMDNIKQTLSTSGLKLKIYGRGFGSALTADLQAETFLEGPFPEILDWEPIIGNKAVRCKWKVSYNQLNCSDSDHASLELDPYVDGVGFGGKGFKLLSLVEEQELDINEMGAITLTVTGFVEFDGNRNYDFVANEGQLTRRRLQQLAELFETRIPLGFHRKTKLKYLKNSRSYSYTIVDTEIQSETAGFPFIVKSDVTHEVSSSLVSDNFKVAGGFYKWINIFNGTFQVRPGAWKGWAWIAFLVYLFNRRDRAEVLIGSPDDFMKDEKDAANKDKPLTDQNKKRTPKQLPLSIRIKEHLHTNQVDITMKYMVLCSLRQLFDATGLFYPLDTLWSTKATLTEVPNNLPVRVISATSFPTDIGTTPFSPRTSDPNAGPIISRKSQWEWFRDLSQTFVQNTYGYRNMQLPNHTFIYNPCPDNLSLTAKEIADFHNSYKGFWKVDDPKEPYRPKDIAPPTTPSNSSSAALGFGAQAGLAAAPEGVSVNYRNSNYLAFTKPEDTWVTRNDSITLIENINASMLPSIEPIGNAHMAASINSGTGLADRKNTGLSINNVSLGFADNKYNNHATMAFGVPTYYVRLTGHAIRVGYGIQCPALYGVYKNPNLDSTALNDSNNLITAYRVGINKWTHKQIAQSVDVPVYMAMWDVTYALQGDPTRSNIVYKTNYASEYV